MNARIILAIALLLAIIATSSWFLYSDSIRQALRPQPSDRPDYSMDNFKYTENDPKGDPRYVLTGTHMDHYPNGDRTLIDTVHIDNYKDGKLLWQADAKQALISGPGKTILLKGKTTIRYLADPTQGPMVLDSSDVLIHTDTDVASSQAPTRVHASNGNIDSQKGFTIDGKTRILTMQGSVSGEVRHD